MTGKKRAANWQAKAAREIERLRYRADFRADIASLPLNDFEARFSALLKISERYGLSSAASVLLDIYARTGNIEPNEAVSKMSVICVDDQTAGPTDDVEFAHHNYVAETGFRQPGVYVFIPPGTDKTAATSFVLSSWDYIESKLLSLSDRGKPKRVRGRPKARRDARVVELARERSGSKLTHEQIAEKINSEFEGENLQYYHIGKILERNRDI